MNFEWTHSDGIVHQARGVTRDISSTGTYIFSDSRPPKNAALDINVSFSSVAEGDVRLGMRAKAVVIRVEPSSIEGEFHGFAVLNKVARLHPSGPFDDTDGVHG